MPSAGGDETHSRSRSRSPTAGLPPVGRSVAESSTRRLLGTVRWYNGRRQVGIINGDDGQQVFVPVGGAYNGNLVPATSGGLFHGTRVSYRLESKPASTDPTAAAPPPGASTAVCAADVRPVEGVQPGLECGVETRIGGRPRQEDRLVANDLYDLGFLACVFDGHGGTRCVDYVSQRFPVVLHACYARRVSLLKQGLASLTGVEEEALISDSFREAFDLTDQEFLVTAREERLREGSTGLAVLIAHGFEASLQSLGFAQGLGCSGGVAKLFVANAGDCRAIVLRGRKAMRVSEDHKPEREDETARIQEAGGMVIRQPCGTHRVGRKTGESRLFLSTSRRGVVFLFSQQKVVVMP
ncbi:unnamed protein product [Polarella glacialis]|uniref:PPM-type phosphatase domain-containing protein n=1 Tax=Polarella glacialis TaxID=89957 RepID=A0A813L414_POLGL|nr:unnamed protein product [Polarella glacialis]